MMLSRAPDDVRAGQGEPVGLDNALDLLCRCFPGFEREIVGKRVLDFGCGSGFQACAMAMRGAEFVLGLDTNPRTLVRAPELASRSGLDGRVTFRERLCAADIGRFDIVISQNSMEHFSDPKAVLDQMKSALAPDGRLLITFGPPWLAPYGSHMRFFTPVPWVNLLFAESGVMKVRSRYIHDGAARYREVEGGLNRMTVRRFERLIRQSGLETVHRRYDCVKALHFLARLPLVRELFINHLSCVLRQADSSTSSE
jgi:SAM-dependent methyltransferase